jgi:tRNA(Ile)-lysidine synthetase-like protein
LKGSFLSDISASTLQTEKRRTAQKLFNELERQLVPFLGEPIALAVSGGLDSRAMLEAVARWPLRYKSHFLVVTVNHHTRAETKAEAEAVSRRARTLGFETEVVSIFSPQKDEASLRTARYEAIWQLLKKRGCRILCTAHQKDDDAEGVVMDLFGFGGGRHGAGIKALRDEGVGKLIRPFLELERRELLLFLTSVGVTDYFEDPSNVNSSCARQLARDFLQGDARLLHPRPAVRLSEVARRRAELLQVDVQPDRIPLAPTMGEMELRSILQTAYKGLCPEKDPRNAGPAIEIIVKKAKSLAFIGSAGVDPSANSITLCRPGRLNFDLPGAKALMTPTFLSLYRNQDDLLVQ